VTHLIACKISFGSREGKLLNLRVFSIIGKCADIELFAAAGAYITKWMWIMVIVSDGQIDKILLTTKFPHVDILFLRNFYVKLWVTAIVLLRDNTTYIEIRHSMLTIGIWCQYSIHLPDLPVRENLTYFIISGVKTCWYKTRVAT